MSTDHINGPWSRGRGLSDAIVDAQGSYVATIFHRSPDGTRKRADLIAAAPTMLKLIKLMDSVLQEASTQDPQISMDQARQLALCLKKIHASCRDVLVLAEGGVPVMPEGGAT